MADVSAIGGTILGHQHREVVKDGLGLCGRLAAAQKLVAGQVQRRVDGLRRWRFRLVAVVVVAVETAAQVAAADAPLVVVVVAFQAAERVVDARHAGTGRHAHALAAADEQLQAIAVQ